MGKCQYWYQSHDVIDYAVHNENAKMWLSLITYQISINDMRNQSLNKGVLG